MVPATSCPACGLVTVPPRARCPQCGAPSGEVTAVEGGGRVVASTWVAASLGLDGFGADGYAVAWVDLDAGPRVQTLVADEAPSPDVRGTVDVAELSSVVVPVFVPETR